MKKGEKFAPIITLVVYFGTDGAWDAEIRYHFQHVSCLAVYPAVRLPVLFHNLLQLFFILVRYEKG